MARENTGILMRCGRCLQQVALSEMKYAKDGKTLVCNSCRGLSIQEHLRALKQKNKGYDASPPTSGKRYACTDCSFTFSRKSRVPTRCPYCAGANLVEKNALSSSRLLED